MNAKKRTRLLKGILAGALALALTLLIIGIVYAGKVTIDTFNFGDEDYTVNSGGVGSSTCITDSVLGGERDTVLYAYNNNVTLYVDRDGSSGEDQIGIEAGTGATYTATVTWDGEDGNPMVLATTGLGGVNVLSDTNDGFLLTIVYKDTGMVNLTIRVYTGTNSSAMTLTMPYRNIETGERVDMLFPFSQFTKTGGSEADFTSVGAIQLYLNGTLATGTDIAVDNLEASNAREYGDLPVSIYGTTILSACHIPQGMRLGANVDAESTYNSSAYATGDDTHQANPDDEDGVTPTDLPWTAGGSGYVDVVFAGCSSSLPCYVNGWIDWNQDGDFNDTVGGASERILSNRSRTSDGTTNYNFTIPDPFTSTYYYARFRICTTSTACDSPTISDTNVINGEVEDYRWPLGPTAVTLDSFTAAWQGDRVQVAWTTAQEVGTVGFNLWRSTSADGEYVQVNDALIPAQSPGGMMGGAYSFADATVTPGSTYFYKLEEIETGGVRNWYGPTSTTGGSRGTTAQGSGNNPTAVILAALRATGGAALAWWPALAGVAGIGLAAAWLWKRRRRET